MKIKTLTILPILFYSGFTSASLYIHQPSVENDNSESRLKIIFDEEKSQKNKDKINQEKEREYASSQEKTHKSDKKVVAKKDKQSYKANNYKNKGKESKDNTPALETPPSGYKDIVASSEHEIEPNVDKIFAKMEEGYLSNSMRKHLESLGWEMRWSSGSDRKITVPYVIEHKEGDIVEFVTQISELYGVFIDVYPKNKTIHVSD